MSEKQAKPVRNERVQEALAVWAERKDAQTHSDVLRRAMAGELLLDISASEFADADNPMQEGDKLVVTSIMGDEDRDLLLAFTDNALLQAYAQNPAARSLAQPAAAALKQALDNHDGIAIDAGTPGAYVAYSSEITRAFGDSPADAARLAAALVDGGVQIDEFVRILREAVLYVGGIPVSGDDGETIGFHLASATKPDGSVLHGVFTSPAELWAWEPRATAQPTDLEKIIAAAREDGMTGLVVNPAGPAAELPLDLFAA
ncbi:SseB family protein [Microbacterium indicum]|uniref:SseB family protein n=1 Tax=Microbacterium indicum TaxID=358100 RepID=UPI00041639B9|nr:SseB family protein [Microbacterium indicum]